MPDAAATQAAAKPAPLQIPRHLHAILLLSVLIVAGLAGLRFLNRVAVFPPTLKDASVGPRVAAERTDVREARIPTEDGLSLYGWVQGRDAAPRKIIMFGGNAEYTGPSAQMYADRCAALDCQFLIFDYRGFANSPGQPSEHGLYRDARGAYNFAITELGWKPAQIILWGRSLGGAVAIRLAHELQAETRREALKDGAPAAALLLEAPFLSIGAMGKHYYPWLIKPEWFAYTIMDNGKLAADLKLPVFQLHGDKDEIIPFEQGEALHAAFKGPKQFLRLEGVMHNNVWQDEARTKRIDQAMDEFLNKHAP